MKNPITLALLAIGLWAGICCCWQTTAKAAQDANLSNPTDTIIATVLGKNILSRDIDPSAEMLEKNRSTMSKNQFDQWLKQYREQKLGGLIGRPLLEKYTKKNRIDANQTEVEDFNKAMNRNMARTAAQWRQARNNLAKELENPDVNETKKEEVKSRISKLDSSIEHMEKGFNMDTQEAKTVIIAWKVNRSLFEKYGGRVIFQQAGPEPLDAYRKFLQEQEAAGNFEIKDNQTADLFWNYFTNEKMHTFYKDPNEAKKFMETPWWMIEPE